MWTDSDFLRPDLLFGLALGNDRGSEAGSKIVRKFVELRVAVDLDGLLGGVADNVAVMAPSQMFFEFSLCGGVNDAVEVIG